MTTVALDIGHGNNTFPPDKGLYKNGKPYPEHSFNSKLVQAIDPLLRKNGIKTVIYQKPNTKDIHLTTRTNHYNRQKVDLVYSIHANASNDSNANGRCVFYWHTSKQSKKVADIVVDEIKKSGYSTHGNGLHASKLGGWTNLHICRETNMPAVLVENGFMTGNKDFDLVFGGKQAEYIKDMAIVHAKAICRYFGVKYDGKDVKPVKPSKPSKPVTKPTSKRKGKSIEQMASEVNAGKHGNGHANRRKSLGISAALYEKVRSVVNSKAGVTTKPKSKSINQMAKEVIDSKHGNGHANRQKSLGINKSTYAKVRSEVNRIATGKPTNSSKPKANYKVGSTVTLKKSASKFATGQSILSSVKGKKYKIIQVKSDRVLLDKIISWVKKSDVQ